MLGDGQVDRMGKQETHTEFLVRNLLKATNKKTKMETYNVIKKTMTSGDGSSVSESRFALSRDSSVGIALGYGLDDRDSRVRFPAGGGNFSLYHGVQNASGAHPASFSMGEADHSPPSSAEVKNAWSCTSTTSVCLLGVVLS
jgi:hypothetical protein